MTEIYLLNSIIRRRKKCYEVMVNGSRLAISQKLKIT